jgi:peptide chain release factor subunit 1
MEISNVEKEKIFLEQFKLRRMIKKLETAEGNGTSLITLVIPAGKRATDFSQMVTEEIGKADNIKDRVNRQSVQMALTSVKEKIRNYLNKALPNGLVIYCGNATLAGHQESRKVMIAFEPYKEVNTKVYKCGDKFEIDFLKALLETNERYGFIIVDGNGALYGVLQGNNKSVASYFTVDLPKKHNKGGQSSNRFANIRMERRLIYTKKVCEEANKVFISDNKANVEGIVLAGYADFKSNVFDCAVLDPRLKNVVIKLVDIAYGGEQGFIQAIGLAQDCFKNVRLVQEQKVLNKFYEEITFDTGKLCFGANETIRCLREGAVELLVVWDNLDLQYVELRPKNTSDGTDIVVKYLKLSEIEYKSTWVDKQTNIEYLILDYDSLIDWLSDNYTEFKTELFFVTDKSPEGSQFAKGFSGIGGMLRYKMDIQEFIDYDMENDDNDFI